jgi:Leucine-rich repeat (LRR) protein
MDLTGIAVSDLSHILRLATSLQSLDIDSHITSIRDELTNLDVQELRYFEYKSCEGEDWETSFGSLKDFKEVMDKNDNLKAVSLTFRYSFNETLSQHACDQSLARWKQIKEEMRLICVRKGIEVLDLTVSIGGYTNVIWEDGLG